MVFVPVMVVILVRMNRAYAREREELDEGLEPFVRGDKRRPVAVLLVEDLDRKTMHALQYAKTIRSSATYAVHVEGGPVGSERLRARWAEMGIDVPLRILPRHGDLPRRSPPTRHR